MNKKEENKFFINPREKSAAFMRRLDTRIFLGSHQTNDKLHPLGWSTNPKGLVINKKGGEKLLSIWWIFVLVLIAGTVVIAVGIYYSAEINVNRAEAEILAQRIIMCVSDTGKFNFPVSPNSNQQEFADTGYLNKNIENIFDNCNINKNLFENSSNFYLKIDILDGEKVVSTINSGQSSFFKDCLIEDKITSKYYPRCSKKEINLLDGEKNLKIIVLTGSNQKGSSF